MPFKTGFVPRTLSSRSAVWQNHFRLAWKNAKNSIWSSSGLKQWVRKSLDDWAKLLRVAPRRVRPRNISLGYSRSLLFESLESRAMLSGNAPFSPVLQLETTSGVIESANVVSQWQDLSGSGNDVFALGAERPLLGTVQTPSGVNAIRFDGVDDRLIRSLEDGAISALPVNNASRTTFMVAQFHNAGAYGGATYGRFGNFRAFGVGVAGPGSDHGDLTLQTWGLGNDLISDSPAFDPPGTTNGWMIISAVHANDGTNPADNEFLYQNGVEIASRSNVLNTKNDVLTTLNGRSVSRLVLGEEIRELGHIQMDVAAWLVYDGALSATDRQAVEAYLTQTYLNAGNQSPTAADDAVTINDGATTPIDILANDSDSDGAIDPTTVTIVSQPANAASISVNPTTGVVTYQHDGSGQADSFTYTVRDNQGAVSNVATVSINLSGNAPPVARDNSAVLANGDVITIRVVDNDNDIDGTVDPTTVAIVDQPAHAASVTVNSLTGRITYGHDGSGADDFFTYTLRDNLGAVSNPATVAISIAPANLSPIAATDRVILDNGAQTVITVLANDYDGDGGAVDPTTVTLVDPPSQATSISVDPATGAITYRHNGSATPDSFSYIVRDNTGLISNVATVEIAMSNQALSLAGFSDSLVFNGGAVGISQPISLAFLPDGRMLILQKDGVIWISDPNTKVLAPYLTLTNIDFGGEKGLLDITLAPDFDPDSPGDDYLYLYYTPAAPGRARIARFTHQENDGGLTSRGALGSEFEVWRDTTGYIACCHYGGGLDFGPDGKLWLTSSDKFTAPNPGEGSTNFNLPQDLASAGGSVIRVNPDGTAPDGTDGWPANPFIDPVDDDPALPGNQDYHDYIWAYGLRNPFRARWDIESGRFFLAEVGGNVQNFSSEDVHVATLDAPATNFGWPNHEGPGLLAFGNPIEHSTPIFSYAHDGSGASLTGGEVYHGDQFPAEWDGVYFYGDFTRDFIRYLTFDSAGNVSGDFAFKPTAQIPIKADQVVYIGAGNDGALYYVLIGGEIRRVTHANGNAAPQLQSIGVDTQSGPAPLTVNFTASVSDPEGDAMTYIWHFGDGTTSSGAVVGGAANANHIYNTDGIYEAHLEVSDGATTVFSQVLPIGVGAANLAPTIGSFSVDPDSGDPPLDVTFSAQVSDPEGDPLTYEIIFGDGQSTGFLPVSVGGAIMTNHTYSQAGSFTARLRVSDGVNLTLSNTLDIAAGQTNLPPVTAGLVVLLESDIKLSVSEGTTVAGWLDGSGFGNNLDALGDPQVIFDATPGGRPAIEFDGDGDKLERFATAELNNLPGGASDRTVFTVVQYIAAQGVYAGFAFGVPSANKTFGLVTDGNGANSGNLAVQGYGGANDFTANTAGQGAGWLTESVIVSGNGVTHYKDGSPIHTFNHTYATDVTSNNSKIVIGQEIGGLGYSQMSIAAVLVYNRALSESERQQVESYLNFKYLVGNLPPVANDDSASVATGASVSIDILANDSDADGILNPATVTIVDPPASGTLTVDPQTGQVTYQHDGGASAFDSFTYTVDDEVAATSNIATVNIALTTGMPSANQQIVRWHGDYYQHLWDSNFPGGAEQLANRWLRGGTSSGEQKSILAQDYDQDGEFDDSRVYFDFSLNSPLNPLKTPPPNKPEAFPYHDELPSATFYGGLSATFYNYQTKRIQQAFIEDDGAGGDLAYVAYEPSPYLAPEYQELQDFVENARHADGRYRKNHNGPQDDFAINLYRPDLPHPLDPGDDPSDNLVTFAAAFLWRKEDFLAGGAANVVSLDADSEFSFESTRWWDNIGEARWILEDADGTLYISQFAVAGQLDKWGHTNTFSDPLSSSWAVYAPQVDDVTFDSSAATWLDPVSLGLFQDILAVGIHIANDTPSGDLTKFSLDEIRFNAVVTAPALNLNSMTAGLVVDLNAGADVTTAQGGEVVEWLDCSGNGNDLQASAGDAQLLSATTPSGRDAVQLDGDDSLTRDGSIGPLDNLASGSGDRTLFFVVNYHSASSFGRFSYGASGANHAFGLGVSAPGNLTLRRGGGTDFDSSQVGVGDNWLVQSVVLAGDQYRHYADGVLVDSGIHTFDTHLDDLTVGQEIGGLNFVELDVAAALVYERALTEAERQLMQSFLHTTYVSAS